MTSSERYPESDPRRHTSKIKKVLSDTIDHLREDVGKIEDPRAEALFETTAEVLTGLRQAFQDYEDRSEEAWRS